MENGKEYLKMADVFTDPVVNDADCLLNKDLGEIADFSGYKKQCRYAAHAINSHDELVAEVERLRESNKRMAGAIWSKANDQGSQGKDIEMTKERFIEQYCCFPDPHQK